MRLNFKDVFKGKNGFEYVFDRGVYKINHPKKEPTSLFKYYSNSRFSYEALFENYLYLSHPFDFNDSLDCSELIWDFSGLTEKDYLSYNISSKLDKATLKKKYLKGKLNGFFNLRRNMWIENTYKLGIVSLTNNPLNKLMWAHYSGESGFMIELDYKTLIDEIKNNNLRTLINYVAYPINYVKRLKQIKIANKFNSFDVPFLYSFGTKYKEWKYEEEWRIICFMNNLGVPLSKVSALKKDIVGNSNRKLFYKKKALKKIILGMYFFNKSFVKHVSSTTPNNPLIYTLKHSKEAEFINHISKFYSNNIYLSGVTLHKGQLKRSYEKIYFEKLGYNRFKRVRTGVVKFY